MLAIVRALASGEGYQSCPCPPHCLFPDLRDQLGVNRLVPAIHANNYVTPIRCDRQRWEKVMTTASTARRGDPADTHSHKASLDCVSLLFARIALNSAHSTGRDSGDAVKRSRNASAMTTLTIP
jgi:hypothetical protein